MSTVTNQDWAACLADENKEMKLAIAEAVKILDSFYEEAYSSWHRFAEEGEAEPENMQEAIAFINKWQLKK